MYSIRCASSPRHFSPRGIRRTLRVFDDHPLFRSYGPFATIAVAPRVTSTTGQGANNDANRNSNSNINNPSAPAQNAPSSSPASPSSSRGHPPSNPFEVLESFFSPPSRRDRRSSFGPFASFGDFSQWPFSSPISSSSSPPSDFFNDQIFSLFNSNTHASLPFPFRTGAETGSTWAPAVEIQTYADRYTIRAQVPGAKKEDLKIELVSDGEGRRNQGGAELVISGKVEINEKGKERETPEKAVDNNSNGVKREETDGVSAQASSSNEDWSIVNDSSSSSSAPPSPSSTATTTPLVSESSSTIKAGDESAPQPESPSAGAKEVGGQQQEQQQSSSPSPASTLSSSEATTSSESWGRSFFRGEFSRSLRFPTPISLEGIKAKYENGLLTIEVPKKEPEPPKSVTIE